MLDLCGLFAIRSINEFGNFLGNSTNWFQFGTNCACDTFKQSVFIEKIDETKADSRTTSARFSQWIASGKRAPSLTWRICTQYERALGLELSCRHVHTRKRLPMRTRRRPPSEPHRGRHVLGRPSSVSRLGNYSDNRLFPDYRNSFQQPPIFHWQVSELISNFDIAPANHFDHSAAYPRANSGHCPPSAAWS